MTNAAPASGKPPPPPPPPKDVGGGGGVVNEAFVVDAADEKKRRRPPTSTNGVGVAIVDANAANSGVATKKRSKPKGTWKSKVRLPLKEKWRIIKNVLVLSLAFMLQFTSFQGIANLQSSINASEGLGTKSLSWVYVGVVLSCLVVPTYLIKSFGAKWTLFSAMLCYVPFIVAQLYPSFFSLVPTGFLLGVAAAPMWTAKASYITQVGSVYAKLTDQPVEAIIVRFFGFFFFAWQTAELWGNLISSLVLSSGPHGSGGARSIGNVTLHELDLCGVNFCISDHGHDAIERPEESEIRWLTGIYLACVIAAATTVCLFLDPLTRYGEGQEKKKTSGKALLTASLYQLKKPNQLLLIPITAYVGIEQAFIGAEFTQAYVACSLGISHIGFVMVCFGVVNAVCSVLWGSLMKYVGRVPIFVFGFATHLGLMCALVAWTPDPNSIGPFFVVSGLWGVGDAVWQTQVHGIYGTLFRRSKEAAFSNYRLWEAVGFVIAYAYSNHLCVLSKVQIMIVDLTIGFIGYIIVEVLRKRRARRRRALATEAEADAAAASKQTQEIDRSVAAITTIGASQPTVEAAVQEGQEEEEEEDDEQDEIDDNIIITQM